MSSRATMNQPLKIGVILRKFDPSTGVSKFVVEITRWVNPSLAKFVLVTNVSVNMKRSKLSHLKIYQIGGSSTLFLFKARQIKAILESEKIDVVSVHGGFFSCVSLPFYRVLSIPMVFFSHATKCLWRDFRFLKPKDFVTQWRLLLDFGDVVFSLITPRRILSAFLKLSNLTAAVYPTCEETIRMKKYLPQKNLYTIPSGGADACEPSSSATSSCPSAMSNPAQSGPRILFFGRSRLTRGIDTLIDAFPRVLQKFPNCKLGLFLLNDKDKEKIIKQLQKSKEQKSIFLSIGHQENMPSYLESADLVALPFRWGRSMPSYPLTVLEAMCMGKVVLTSRVGAITKFIQDKENGVLIDDPRDSEKIADKIIETLSNSEHRKKMESNARRTVEKFFLWKNLAASFYKIHLNAFLEWNKSVRQNPELFT